VSLRAGHFPPQPRGLKGRDAELTTLGTIIETTAPARVALVGWGGSGKSMLAAALAYRLKDRFGGRMHWFRVGAWDFRTLAEMMALRFGTTRDREQTIPKLRAHLSKSEHLVVLDNHEDDAAMARLLDALTGTKATFLITARRCLLAGVLVFPVTAPLVTSTENAFPRVASLTRRLRWSPLALDIADAIVGSRATTAAALAKFLDQNGIGIVRVIDHEDDLPEVALLVKWAWRHLPEESKRILGILAFIEGDNVDRQSLAELADVPKNKTTEAIEALERWHLVQEAMPQRYQLHAVVRYAVQKRTEPIAPDRVFEHYVGLLERHPHRLVAEQTHLFAAMDQAHRTSSVDGMVRVKRLLTRLGQR
jgi:hypothetical protein